MRSRGALRQRSPLALGAGAIASASGHDARLATPTRTKTLQVGGLVAVTSALQFAAAAAVGLLLFGSAAVFCALAVGGYYFVWSAHDGEEGPARPADAARDLVRLERGLGRAHRGGGLGGAGLLPRLLLRRLVAAGDKLAAFRRSVLGFSFTVSLADSAPVPAAAAPPAREAVEIAVVPAVTGPPAALALPPHLKLLPAGGAKTPGPKKKAKKARRRSKPKDLVTIFTSSLARDAPIKTVQRVEMPPVKPSFSELMALKPAPAPAAAVTPAGKPLKAPAIPATAPRPTSKSEPVTPHAHTARVVVGGAPKRETGAAESRVLVDKRWTEPEPEVEVEVELPPVLPRKVTLYVKPAPAETVERPAVVGVEEKRVATESPVTESEDADFLFAISLAQPSAEWTGLPPAMDMKNAELREMVEELDAMSREVDAALAASAALLASLEA